MIILIMMLLIGCVANSEYFPPQTITASGTFSHEKTNTNFPAELEGYHRVGITSHSKDRTNVSVEYEGNDGSHFTIFVYPVKTEYSDRLVSEYNYSSQAIAIVEERDFDAKQESFLFISDDYSIPGIKLYTDNLSEKSRSTLVLFECGQYFLKYRIESEKSDELVQNLIITKLSEWFNPAQIIESAPLLPKANVQIDPIAFADTLVLYTAMSGAFKHVNWAVEKIDSLNRCAGFPGIYLEGQVSAYREMATSWRENPKNFKININPFWDSLVEIDENGFLDEFLMLEYNMLLLPADSSEFDFEAFIEWKDQEKPTFALQQRYFYPNYGI